MLLLLFSDLILYSVQNQASKQKTTLTLKPETTTTKKPTIIKLKNLIMNTVSLIKKLKKKKLMKIICLRISGKVRFSALIPSQK